jgi:hypothetical protein
LTINASVSPTASVTPSNTPSITPTASPSITPTTTATPSVTRSVSVTPSFTPSNSPSTSPGAPASPSVTPTPSLTPSLTPSKTITPTASQTPSVSPSSTPVLSFAVSPSVTPTTTISPTASVSITPSRTPSPTPSKSLRPSPSITPTPTPSASRLPAPISNTEFTNFNVFNINEISFISNDGGSNLPDGNKNGNEFVSNTILNKALLKLISNNKALTSYLNFRFSGNYNPCNNIVTSGDIIPLSKEERDSLNFIYDSNTLVNVNEKTAPQVLNRIFEQFYNWSQRISKVTNVEITNFDQLVSNVNCADQLLPSPSATPSVTPSKTPSASITPSTTPSTSLTPSFTPTPTATPSKTPSITPSSTPVPPPTGGFYTLRVVNGIINGAGSVGTFETNTPVTISANPVPYGYQYGSPIWTGSTTYVDDTDNPVTTFEATIDGDYTVIANLVPVASVTPSITPTRSVTPSVSVTLSPSPSVSVSVSVSVTPSAPVGTFNLTITNGTGNGSSILTGIPVGTIISLEADTPESGATFTDWAGSGGYKEYFILAERGIASPNALWRTFTPGDYTLIAKYNVVTINNYQVQMFGGGISSPLVGEGAVSGTFPVNSQITITADNIPAGKEFASWSVKGAETEDGPTSPTYTIGSREASPTTFTGTSIGVFIITAVLRDPETTFNLTVTNGSGDGTGYPVGVPVNIVADPAPSGYAFKVWGTNEEACVGPNCSIAKVTNTALENTTFVAYQAGTYNVTATYYIIAEVNNFSLQVVNGTQSGNALPGTSNIYLANTPVTIEANAPDAGFEFDKWVLTVGAYSNAVISDIKSQMTTFTSTQVGVYTITATYKSKSQFYQLNVGSRATILTNQNDPQGFPVGTSVEIQANEPAENEVFGRWAGDVQGVADIAKPRTTFTGSQPTTYQISVTFVTSSFNNYTVSVSNGTVDNVQSKTVAVNTVVTLQSNPPATGKKFKQWVITGGSTVATPGGEGFAGQYVIGNAFASTTNFKGLYTAYFYATAEYEDLPPPTVTPTPTPPPQKYTLNVDGGSGNGEYDVGQSVTIIAEDRTSSGYRFTGWSGDSDFLSQQNNSSAVFTGTTAGATYSVTAEYEYYGNIVLEVVNGTGSGTYDAGSTINISADAPLEGEEFALWQGDTRFLSSVTSANPTMTPPPGSYLITAVYATVEIGAYVYNLEVFGGSGSGVYGLGETAAVQYDDPGGYGTFNYWSGDVAGIAAAGGSATTPNTVFRHYKTGAGPFTYTLYAQAS